MQSFSFGVTEVKLLILVGNFCLHFLIYMILFGVTIINYNFDLDYFTCEFSGHNPNNPCDDSVLISPASIVLSVFTVVLEVTPLMLLVFVTNVKELKEKFKKCGSRK